MRNIVGKIEIGSEKVITVDNLQGFEFWPPLFDGFGRLWQAFFFFFFLVIAPSFDNFPQCQILLKVFGQH